MAKLEEIGCGMAQGYHFAKPQPSNAAERMLAKGTFY
jgi:EAL domain-containing protein (putative c-di-GMP-specific phosphodiesterase class I)